MEVANSVEKGAGDRHDGFALKGYFRRLSLRGRRDLVNLVELEVDIRLLSRRGTRAEAKSGCSRLILTVGG